MKRRGKHALRACFCLMLLLPALALPAHSVAFAQAAAEAAVSPGSLLIVENVGQFNPRARFLVWNLPGPVWLADDGIWLQLFQREQPETSAPKGTRPDEPVPSYGVSLRLSFVGANPDATWEPSGRLPTHVSYLVGNSAQWHPDVPVWSGLAMRDLYPGIDLILDSTGAVSGSALPWRLEVKAGADLTAVRLRVEGADAVLVEEHSLRLVTSVGEIDLPRPRVLPGGSVAAQVAGEAQVASPNASGATAFEIPAALLVDSGRPAGGGQPTAGSSLKYSTLLGGSAWDEAHALAVDSTGAAYVTGRTASTDFPTTPGAFDSTVVDVEAFVVKFNSTGTALIYATVLGGGSTDESWAIAVSSGLASVTGDTRSRDFPTTTGAYDRLCGVDGTCNDGGQGPYTDAFFTRLNSNGTALDYSTYLGGADDERGYGVALDGGNTYLTGITYSTNGFPQPRLLGVGSGDAYLVKFTSGGALAWSKVLGGSDVDAGFAIAARSGYACVAGETSSSDFPASGYVGGREAFLWKLNSGGAQVYAKLLAGSFDDSAYAIEVDASQNAYVAGFTTSPDLPVTDGTYSGGGDAFFGKWNSSGTLLYSTFLGGSGLDEAQSVRIDASGGIYLAGRTGSSNFPVSAGAYQSSFRGVFDGFVSRHDLTYGSPPHITYASYLGGSANDAAYGVALDTLNNAYLAGRTLSSDFPTTVGAFDRILNSRDAFVSRLAVGAGPDIALAKYTNGQDADLAPGSLIRRGEPVTWEYVVRNSGGAALSNVVVTDDQLGSVCSFASLAVGQSQTCTLKGRASADQYANWASATGTPPGGLPNVFAGDLSHYSSAEPGVMLSVARSGQDVVLTWPAVPSAAAYRVYRGTQPYFFRSDPLAQVADPTYTDLGALANPDVNYYYIVLAVDAGGAELAISERAGAFHIPLVAGWNMVSLPVLPATIGLDDVLGTQLHGTCDSATADRVLAWDPATQQYQMAWYCDCDAWGPPWDNHWLSGFDPTSVTLGPDVGVWIQNRSGSAETAAVVGLISATDRVIPVASGWQMLGSAYPVAVPLDSAAIPATGTCDSATADRILAWDSATQQYQMAWYCDCDGWGPPWDDHWLTGFDPTPIQLTPGRGVWYQNRHSPFSWTYPLPDAP